MRDDFDIKTKDTLFKRVGARCSNPDCRKITCGPHSENDKTVNIGVAAHITAASVGGPRYDKSINADDRKSVENGIWLCQTCAKLIDSDEKRYSVELIREWKDISERMAKCNIENPMIETLSEIYEFKESIIYPFNLSGFCWCSISVRLPFSINSDKMHWSDEKIRVLKDEIENHEISGANPWFKKYNPYSIKPVIARNCNSVIFSPMNNHIADPMNDRSWFRLQFDNTGLMTSNIGFLWNEPLYIESIIKAFYASFDLFSKSAIRSCYDEALWAINKYKVSYNIFQFPGSIETRNIDGTKQDDFAPRGSSFGGHAEILEDIGPERATNYMARKFLGDLGFWNLGESLEQYLNKMNEHFQDNVG